jgi:hypothetical protein
LIEELRAARLLSKRLETHGDEQVDVVDIIHESLISNWHRLRQATIDERAVLQERVRFEQALWEWLSEERGDAYLLDGLRLEEAQELEQRGDIALQGDEACKLLRRSIDRREAERQRQVRRTRAIASVLGVLLLVALAAAGLAVQEANNRTVAQRTAVVAEAQAVEQRNNALTAETLSQRDANALATEVVVRSVAESQAQTQANRSESRRLANLGLDALQDKPVTALLLAAEALAYDHNSQSDRALRDAIGQLREPIELGTAASAVFSPDGQRIVTISADITTHHGIA